VAIVSSAHPSPRRVLLVVPYAPRIALSHGSARVLDGLLGPLCAGNDVVVLQPSAETATDPRDDAARYGAVAVHEYDVPAHGRRLLPDGIALLRGRSLRASGIPIRALRAQLSALERRYRPDVVQVEDAALGDVLRAATSRALRVLTVYDPAASQRENIALPLEGRRFVRRLDARAALRQERRVLRFADAAVAFSERDRKLLARHAPHGTDVVTIPLGWEVPDAPLDPTGTSPPTVLFIGNFMHPPNIDAALRLGSRIFPKVLERHPDVRLDIVGDAPPAVVRALANATISVTGFVPDVNEYLNRAAVVAAPLTVGGGTRVKVLEALAAGKAVVATTRAAEGIATTPEVIAIADDDEAFAAAVGNLLSDVDMRRQLALGARDWAVRNLAWSTMADRYGELYERLARSRRARS
jgi:glycosyltransferase involved in cell wall biosynthesis